MENIPVYFHAKQLEFEPAHEWSRGQRIAHPETPDRARNILTALDASGGFEVIEPSRQPTEALRQMHAPELLQVYDAARELDETLYPSVFPHDVFESADPTQLSQAGRWCFDTGTPLNKDTFEAAAWSAACAYEAAERLAAGSRLVYALSRPPGHHATEQFFGGYSYFANTAVAARRLSSTGRVAVLDIDFHHGNGTQSIFYDDPTILTVSIHGDPRAFFPYYCGFVNERGKDEGTGYNLNLCLPAKIDIEGYMEALEEALGAIDDFGAEILVLAAGFDGYELDPIGDWRLETEDFSTIGARIAKLKLPTLVVQEGGYYTEHLGRNAVALLSSIV